jgi:hypothetical protein
VVIRRVCLSCLYHETLQPLLCLFTTCCVSGSNHAMGQTHASMASYPCLTRVNTTVTPLPSSSRSAADWLHRRHATSRGPTSTAAWLAQLRGGPHSQRASAGGRCSCGPGRLHSVVMLAAANRSKLLQAHWLSTFSTMHEGCSSGSTRTCTCCGDTATVANSSICTYLRQQTPAHSPHYRTVLYRAFL